MSRQGLLIQGRCNQGLIRSFAYASNRLLGAVLIPSGQVLILRISVNVKVVMAMDTVERLNDSRCGRGT